MTGSSQGRAYRAGVAVAFAASLLIVWTTIVRDDGTGTSYFLVIMGAVVGALGAWFSPAGMARAMAGVALMQALLGVANATAPSIANMPSGSARALLYGGFFAALWFVSAAFFRVAARRNREAAAARPNLS